MAIGLYNADNGLYQSLSSFKTIKLNSDTKFTALKGLFIDWIDTNNKNKPSKEYAYQAALISYYSKKNIPIVIYDRFMCISSKELKWLKRFNTHLYEPALNNRKDFIYQPHWMELDDYKLLELENDEREYDLGHTGQMSDSLDKYYKDCEKKYADIPILYNVDSWRHVKSMIAIDSKRSYNIGYLNQSIIDALTNGCMILCPIEHKYYSNMFHGNIVEDIDSVHYWVKHMSGTMRIANSIGVYESIRARYPEFTIENTIKNMFGVLR